MPGFPCARHLTLHAAGRGLKGLRRRWIFRSMIAEKKRRRSVVRVVVKVETEKKQGSPSILEFEGRKIIRKPTDMPYEVAQEIIDKIEIGQMTGEEDGFRWAKDGF